MRVVNDSSGDYPDGPTVRINLTRLSTDNTDTVLFYGYQSVFNDRLRDEHVNYKRKILLNLWQPTEYCMPGQFVDLSTPYIPDGKLYDYFDEIYSICPYTIDFQQQFTGHDKYKLIWHPFAAPEDYGGQPLNYDKVTEVCYFGGIHGSFHHAMAKVLQQFNHRICYVQSMPYVTDVNLTHHAKMQLAANSKVTVVYNQCGLNHKNIDTIRSTSNWDQNEAFAGLTYDNPIICQLKCRLFEALYCKNVILVKRDRWNIVERFLSPDAFIYFEDEIDLAEKIKFVLTNYSQFSGMLADNYDISMRYAGKQTYKFIRDGKSC